MLVVSYSRARKPATTGAMARFLTTSSTLPALVIGILGEAVGAGVVLVTLPVPVGYGTVVFEPSTEKFAQEIRVLFAKWNTTLRLPKYEPAPSLRDVYGS